MAGTTDAVGNAPPPHPAKTPHFEKAAPEKTARGTLAALIGKQIALLFIQLKIDFDFKDLILTV